MAWNGSDSAGQPANGKATSMASPRNQTIKQSNNRTILHGLLAFLIIVSLGGAALWFFTRPAPKVAAPKETKKPAAIKQVTPVPATTNKVEVAEPLKPVRRTRKGTIIPDVVQPDEHGVMRWPGGLMWVDTNDLHMVHHPRPKKLFKHASDNRIANLLTMDPVKMPVFMNGRRLKFDKRFVEDFKASLVNPEVIDSNDTPEEANLRRAVNETKAELRQRMDAGEDIAKLLNETQSELERLCQYRHELKKELDRVTRDENISDDDVRDYVKAANQMLEKQGIKTFAMPKLMNRQLKFNMLRQQREKANARKN